MFLNEIAQENMKEQFLGMDIDTREFTSGEGFLGRLGPTDRFLSIYNRPTRMRQVFVKPDTVLPASGVVKHAPTGEIYLIGVSRSDSVWDVASGDPYVSIVMAHLVTPNGMGTAGQAKLFRKLPPTEMIEGRDTYVGDDGKVYGWLEDTEIYDTYADVEFRTTKAEPGTVGERVGDYYAWLPYSVELKEHDRITIDDDTYFVSMAYTDLGMVGATLAFEGEKNLDFIYLSTKSYFEPGYGQVTEDIRREVTGIISSDEDRANWASGAVSYIDVAVLTEHIGFTPKTDDFVVYEGRKRRVKSVALQATKKQYILRCE